MFGGLGGALKNLTGKAEEILEKTKKGVEELAVEKKAAAASMLEGQAKKTGDALLQTKGEVENTATGVVLGTKQTAIDGFDKEISSAEKAVDHTLQEAKKEAKTEAAQSSSISFDPAMLANLAQGDKAIDQAVAGALQQVGTVVDNKIKDTDKFLDDKREEVVKQVQGEAAKATENTSQGVGSILGKAKGLLNF